MHGLTGGSPADDTTDVRRPGEWLRDGSWWAAVAGGVIGFPIAVLLHELGHFGAFAAFGFPDPVLSYGSADWDNEQFDALMEAGDVDAAWAIAQPWQEAVGVAAGPIVSYLLMIACVPAVRRFGPGPLSLVFAIGLVTPFRWSWPIPILYLMARGARISGGPDEIEVAALTGIPQWPLILLALASLVLGYWFIVAALPRGKRLRSLVPTFVGSVLGGVLWALWLGPMVLP